MSRLPCPTNIIVAACAISLSLFTPLLSGCAVRTASRQNSSSGFDEVLWTNNKTGTPTRLFVTMTRSFEPDFTEGIGGDADNIDDLNNYVMRNAQAALREAKSHGGNDVKIVFFVRSQPGWKIGYGTELTLSELEEIAAASRNQARKLLYPHQWLIIHLPESLQPSATASAAPPVQ